MTPSGHCGADWGSGGRHSARISDHFLVTDAASRGIASLSGWEEVRESPERTAFVSEQCVLLGL